MNNTSFFGQLTPIKQNRIENSFLFGNTTTIQPSTPSNLFGRTSPSTTFLHASSIKSNTIQKYETIARIDQITKDDIQTQEDNKKFSSSFTFQRNQISPSPTPTFTMGNSSSLFPTTTTTSNTSFNFSLSKPTTTSALNISSSTTTPTPTLFSTTSTMNSQSSTDLQLFQTMLNTQPFNNELNFLTRNIKSNGNLDRARLCTVPNLSTNRLKTNIFSSILTKPSVLSLNSTLSTQSNIFSSSSTKRKLADSFLDDDDDNNNNNSLIMDDGLSSTNKISKINIKRPRMLDMNKIRSIVLGNNETIIPNETFFVTSSSTTTSENLSEWKKFSTYNSYITSKNHENKFNQERAFRLPTLTHNDYYTKPTIDELRSYFNEQGQCFIKQFTIARKHYGSVTFQGLQMNLAGLDLDRLIEIDRRQVTVYPNDNDRPIEGEELNCQAIISLLGVYPIDRSISNSGEEVTDPNRLIEMNYGNYLEEMTKKFHGKFLDYDVYTGTWRFQVEHF